MVKSVWRRTVLFRRPGSGSNVPCQSSRCQPAGFCDFWSIVISTIALLPIFLFQDSHGLSMLIWHCTWDCTDQTTARHLYECQSGRSAVFTHAVHEPFVPAYSIEQSGATVVPDTNKTDRPRLTEVHPSPTSSIKSKGPSSDQQRWPFASL